MTFLKPFSTTENLLKVIKDKYIYKQTSKLPKTQKFRN